MFSPDTNLCIALQTWKKLLEDDEMPEVLRKAIKERFKQAVTPFHIIAFMVGKKETDPDLPPEKYEEARQFFRNLYPSLFVYLIGYEIKDTTLFFASVFENDVKRIPVLQPVKYWQYVGKVCALPAAKEFCNLMESIFVCPASSAGLERVFSSFGLVHTKLRNRLGNEKAAKLVKIYCALK